MKQVGSVIFLLSIIGNNPSTTEAFSPSPSYSSRIRSVSWEDQRRSGSCLISCRRKKRNSTDEKSTIPLQMMNRRGNRLGQRKDNSFNTKYGMMSPISNISTNTISSPHASITRLHLSKKDEDNKGKTKTENDNVFLNLFRAKLYPTFRLFKIRIKQFFPTFKVALASFTVGAALSLGLVLIPVYDSVDKMTEPVQLFETILADLDRGYVDKVDTTKLFETGVGAMLRSLDPYTEFEGKQQAVDLNESVSGKYGGIGLVISGSVPQRDVDTTEVSQSIGTGSGDGGSTLLPQEAIDEQLRLQQGDDGNVVDDEDDIVDGYGSGDDEDSIKKRIESKKRLQRAREQGIRVISAMEGYAFDYGLRPGDKIVAVDGKRLSLDEPVENVRNMLRGDPGSEVAITIERVGLKDEVTLTVPRTIVQMRDVKLATFVGKRTDGIGYIQLTGFTANSGRDVRNSIYALQKAAEDVSDSGLKGLILDLRGNPGGLLTSAVDVSSLFVPKGSEIVSAKGRGFPGVRYISRVDPVVDPETTKVAILINENTASAAEIVSGAIQDLDVGVIVGSDRTFGKGLVQNIADLPFDTALKYTVAKYYTPSGRCIQSTNYKAGEASSKVADRDKSTFYTANGREVQDGGGIAADLKVDPPKASALEFTLLKSGSMTDYAAEWSKTHELTDNFSVDSKTYKEFQDFVMARQKSGDLKLDALYSEPINQLRKTLKQSGYNGATKEVKTLEASIVREMKGDFDKYSEDIKEDIEQSILARYLPESMLRELSIKTDKQVITAVKLLSNDKQYDKLLGRADTNSSPLQTALASNGESQPSNDDTKNIVNADSASVRLNLNF